MKSPRLKLNGPTRRRRVDGDMHVGSMAADVRPVPGSGTSIGEKRIAVVMSDALDRVRDNIRRRATNPA